MKNFVQVGDVLDFTAPAGGVVSGLAYVIGVAFLIAASTAAEGERFAGVVEGVATLPKASGAVTEGALVYWDNTAKNVTTTASGNKKIGYAVNAQGADDTIVSVKLVPTI